MTDEHRQADSNQFVFVQPGTNEAAALCFLYTNADFGFNLADVCEHTSIPRNKANKALVRLKEEDLIGKTADGYYHALDDSHIARYAECLRKEAAIDIDVGEDAYPNELNETSTGFPGDDG